MAEVVGLLGPTAADLQSMNHNYYIVLISITILVYDFILTFPAEVERFWFVGRVNCAICLFYLNRYLVLFGYIPILLETFWVNNEPTKLKVCHDLQAYHEYFSAVVQVIMGAMLIMRIYALYRRDIRVLVFLVVISAILFAIGCWAGFGGSNQKPDVDRDVLVNIGCGIFQSHFRARRLALTWGLLFIFDLIIFGMTLYRTLTVPRSIPNMLITVLMRDGAVYFGIVATCNLITILFLLLGEPLSRDQGVTLTNALSSVMITRLMLNLRDPSFISTSERNASEVTTYPDLTFVESHYPTQLSDRGGFAESESRDGDEAGADLDLHRPAGDIELHRIGV